MPIRVSINGKEQFYNNQLEYINALKQISDQIDRKKVEDTLAPTVSTQSVIIGAKGNYIHQPANNSVAIEKKPEVIKETVVDSNKLAHSKLTATFPKGNYPISSATQKQSINDEYDMSTSKPNEEMSAKATSMINKTKIRKMVNYPKLKKLRETRFVIQRITEDDILTENDIKQLNDSPVVFVSGTTSNKEDTTFFDNLEILKKNRCKTTKAAFISGQATTSDKVTKEAMKVIKMCSKGIDSGVICYELNNEDIKTMENDEQILEAFKSAEQLSDILYNEGYSPLICADLDVRTKINNALM